MNETDQIVALRAVIDTARRWAHAEGSDAVEDAGEALQDAVTALEAILEPKSSGFIVKRMWQELQPWRDWVSPEGSSEWFRVLDVVPFNNDDGTVDVTIDLRGREFKAPRKATEKIRTRTHTKQTPTESALEALSAAFPGSEVL